MKYAQEMAGRMPATMPFPEEFQALFDWMETNDFFMPSEAYPGDRLGLLGTSSDVQSDHVTAILFRTATPAQAASSATLGLARLSQISSAGWFLSREPVEMAHMLRFGSTMKVIAISSMSVLKAWPVSSGIRPLISCVSWRLAIGRSAVIA